MQIYNGRIFFKIERCPFYGSGVSKRLQEKGYYCNICLRSWKIPFCKLYIAKRQYVKEISDLMKEKIFNGAVLYFGTSDVTVTHDRYSHTIINNSTGESMSFSDEILKFFAHLKMVSFTKNPQVLYDYDTEKYYGYSHRGSAGFGIGDMLFDLDNESEQYLYCEQKDLRKRYIKRLKHYDRNNDADGFNYLVEEGIKAVIPFRRRGRKIIETSEEAFEAASNFARYVS
jgi:hypothetical protein